MQGYGHYSYSERLSRLKLQSLIVDLLWCYKIVFNIVDISVDEIFCFNTCTYKCGHAYKLYKSRPLKQLLMFGTCYLVMMMILHHFPDYEAQF